MPQSPDAPERMAGMVPGVRAGGFLFLSAIRGRDPATNRMPDDPYEQACQALRNLEAELVGSFEEALRQGELAAERAEAEHELRLKSLELSLSEELEAALEEQAAEHEAAVRAAVGAAEQALLDKHKDEMEQAAAALDELQTLKIKAGELEKTIVRLSPRSHGP